jgi:hypothetical protein
MLVFFGLYVLLCLYGIKINTKGFNFDYMSREKTGSIKGIFVILVLFSHYINYFSELNATDSIVKFFMGFVGQLMVTMFLFYSGYGIMESIKKKGFNYTKNLPLQRIFKVLFDFDLAVLLFLILNLAFGKEPSVKQVLLSLVAWGSLGNSQWYIFAILCTYIMSFIAHFIFRKNHYLAATLTTVLCVLYVLLLHEVQEPHWYNTVICYAMGVWYSLLREKIEKVIQKNNIVWTVSLIASVVLMLICQHFKNESFIAYELHVIFFVVAVLIFTMKVSLDNAVLRKVGEWVFGIYVLQRLPMNVLGYFGIRQSHMYISFVIVVITTILLAWGFSYVSGFTGKIARKLKFVDKKS